MMCHQYFIGNQRRLPQLQMFYGSPYMHVIGRNTLGSMVKKMCKAIGVEGKTNHSLRTTGASHLFQRNMLEKLIQERTGHKILMLSGSTKEPL